MIGAVWRCSRSSQWELIEPGVLVFVMEIKTAAAAAAAAGHVVHHSASQKHHDATRAAFMDVLGADRHFVLGLALHPEDDSDQKLGTAVDAVPEGEIWEEIYSRQRRGFL